MLRRTLIALFFLFFSDNEHLQKMLVVIVILLFVIMNQILKPFKSEKANIFDMVSSVVIIMTYLLPGPNQSPGFALSLFVLIMNLLFLVVLVFFLFEGSIKALLKKPFFKKCFYCFRRGDHDNFEEGEEENKYSSILLTDEEDHENIKVGLNSQRIKTLEIELEEMKEKEQQNLEVIEENKKEIQQNKKELQQKIEEKGQQILEVMNEKDQKNQKEIQENKKEIQQHKKEFQQNKILISNLESKINILIEKLDK